MEAWPIMDETTREQLLDRRITRRLRTDPAYLNAANAHEQAAREEAITAEEEAKLDRPRVRDHGEPLPDPSPHAGGYGNWLEVGP